MTRHIPTGAIVCVERKDRGEDFEARRVPGIVLGQWPDGSLELYLLHFEGVPSYARSVPLSMAFEVGKTEPIERATALALQAT